MFCGSCMHDNTWAHALMAAGAEVSLIPTYTPIRVDEMNASLDRVFFGGINVYLNGKFGFWRSVPRFMKSWLDSPGVIRWATKKSISNDAHELGSLTLSMLQGEHGPHRLACEELADFLGKQLKPDVVIFSNALLAGAVHVIKQRFNGPVLCMLQGDDVFLDALLDQYREPVMQLLKQKADEFDGFLVHSQFYRDYMVKYLDMPVEKFHILPLGIDLSGHDGTHADPPQSDFTVGYFARIAPEKGLHHLAEAFDILKKQIPTAKLKIGGYLGAQHQEYFDTVMQTLKSCRDDVTYIGSPETLQEKVAFFRSVDVLSVPTNFLEPKGLYVLEALANGVPVVQPHHGAFPEILTTTGGGLLVHPKEPEALAKALASFSDHDFRSLHAAQGWQNVRLYYSSEYMAKQTLHVLERFTRD